LHWIKTDEGDFSNRKSGHEVAVTIILLVLKKTLNILEKSFLLCTIL